MFGGHIFLSMQLKHVFSFFRKSQLFAWWLDLLQALNFPRKGRSHMFSLKHGWCWFPRCWVLKVICRNALMMQSSSTVSSEKSFKCDVDIEKELIAFGIEERRGSGWCKWWFVIAPGRRIILRWGGASVSSLRPLRSESVEVVTGINLVTLMLSRNSRDYSMLLQVRPQPCCMRKCSYICKKCSFKVSPDVRTGTTSSHAHALIIFTWAQASGMLRTSNLSNVKESVLIHSLNSGPNESFLERNECIVLDKHDCTSAFIFPGCLKYLWSMLSMGRNEMLWFEHWLRKVL